MRMLTNRTNLLLSDQEYMLLSRLASQRKQSIGSLIRFAIAQTYGQVDALDLEPTIDQTTMRKFQQLWQLVGISREPIDYKALINEGRK